jgi:perosamine synthetase
MITRFIALASEGRGVIVQNTVKSKPQAPRGSAVQAEGRALCGDQPGGPDGRTSAYPGIISPPVAVPTAPDRIPRLPVLGWDAVRGSRRRPGVPSLLDGPHLVFTPSGRMAIALALRALGVGRGDKVLVPTYHCPTMIAPVAHLGANPIFFPIDATGAPDLGRLGRAQLSGAKALIAAHYFGFPRAMDDVRAFCDEHGLAFLEDCAHAMFGSASGRGVGELGDFAIGSLTKFYPVPEGGCLVSRISPPARPELQPAGFQAEFKAWMDILEQSTRWRRLLGLNSGLALLFRAKTLARRFRGSIRRDPENGPKSESQAVSLYDFSYVAKSPPQAVRWVVAHVDPTRIVHARRRNYTELLARLNSLPGAQPLLPVLPEHAVPYVFPLWVDDPESRFRAARGHGLPVFRWDWLWPSTPEIRGDEGRRWARHVFQLPCHQDLSDADLDWMTTTLREIFAAQA